MNTNTKSSKAVKSEGREVRKRALSPVAKEQMIVFNKMQPALQEVAKQFVSRNQKIATGVLLVTHAKGLLVQRVREDAASYGANAVGLLSEYLNEQPTMLYAYQKFAMTYTEDQARELGETQMANGKFLTFSHVRYLQEVASEKSQQQLLTKCISNGWTVQQLRAEASGMTKATQRSGGRPVSSPTSPMAGMMQVVKQSQLLNNRFATWETTVFDALDQAEPEKFNPTLRQALMDSEEQLTALMQHVREGLERVRLIVSRADRIADAVDTAKLTDDENLVPVRKVKVKVAKKKAGKVTDKPANSATDKVAGKRGRKRALVLN